MVESSLGIVGACLPLMQPVFADLSNDSFVRAREEGQLDEIHLALLKEPVVRLCEDIRRHLLGLAVTCRIWSGMSSREHSAI